MGIGVILLPSWSIPIPTFYLIFVPFLWDYHGNPHSHAHLYLHVHFDESLNSYKHDWQGMSVLRGATAGVHLFSYVVNKMCAALLYTYATNPPEYWPK